MPGRRLLRRHRRLRRARRQLHPQLQEDQLRRASGRFDGNVSRANDTLGQNLPPPFADLATLTKMFADKGLDQTDVVVLSGAHTVGISHCPSFSDRVHPPTSPSPNMDPTLAAKLNQTCDTPNNATTTVSQDYETPNALDNQYYKNILSGKVLFTSDAALNSSETLELVKNTPGQTIGTQPSEQPW
ncbi:hypothetical protein QYE76_059250 [Lolium multiflorum]|uniref:peroxidase n=1 Tax=Lolium multiflorum TaxID=4521 RepID=A0AAD8V761_LOLMU|nr:hypothetical protein QYE76_059250 [Lolium multiflorum]